MPNTKIMLQFNAVGITAFEVDEIGRPTGQTFDVVGVLGTTFTSQSSRVVAQAEVAATATPVQVTVSNPPQIQTTVPRPVQAQDKSNRIVSVRENGVKYLVDGIEYYAGYTAKTGKFVTWTNAGGYKDAVKNHVVKALGDLKLYDIANAVSATKPLADSIPEHKNCSVCGTLVKSANVLRFSEKKFGKVICYDCQRKTNPSASEASAPQTTIPVVTNSVHSATVNQCAPGADVLNAVFSGASEASAPTTPQGQTSIPVPNQCAAPGVDAGQVIPSEPVDDGSYGWSGYPETSDFESYVDSDFVYDDSYVYSDSPNPSFQEGPGEVIQTSVSINPLVADAELQSQLDVLANLSQAQQSPSSPADMDKSQGNVRRTRSRRNSK